MTTSDNLDQINSDLDAIVDRMCEILIDLRSALYDINENITELKTEFVRTTNEYTYPRF